MSIKFQGSTPKIYDRPPFPPASGDRPLTEVVIRPMMYVALSYDYRVIVGRESVGTLVWMKEALENPEEFLMGGNPMKALGL